MSPTSLFRNRNLVILWLGQAVSNLGNPFTAIAASWLVYELTGSKLALGGLLLANALPLAALRLVAGPLVDRWDRRRVMLVADLLRAAVLLTPVWLLWHGRLAVWHLFVVNAVSGAAEAFFSPAVFAVVPRLVPARQLVEANSLINTTFQGALLVGPLLAGLVVAGWGVAWALLIDAATFAVSALSLLFLPAQAAASGGHTRHFLRELGEGFAFFRRLPALLWLLSLASVSNLATGVAIAVALPFAREVLGVGAAGYGMMQPGVAVGFLAGSLVALLLKRLPRRVAMIGSHTISGGLLAAQALSRSLPLTLALLAGFGLCVAVWNTFSGALYQHLVPDHLRGRVQSVRLLVAQGSTPLGMAIGGTLAEWLGIQAVFAVVGLLIAGSGVLGLLVPGVRRVDSLTEEAAG